MNDSMKEIKPTVCMELSLGMPIRQCRAIPVCLGANKPKAFLAVYAKDSEIDPYTEMFFFPTDVLKIALFTEKGEILWKRDLGKGVVPGLWFCPFYPFDLDGDGVDEIWYVNNPDSDHPLGVHHRTIERIDPLKGEVTGSWPWMVDDWRLNDVSLSRLHRNFLLGGYVLGEPVLVAARGTYGNMILRGYNKDMSIRWERYIDKSEPGAEGSHMCCVTDLDKDGINEVLWGERCIEFDRGTELFCADRDVYSGHSDVVMPVRNPSTNEWFIYTCREGDYRVSPRVVMFDAKGKRVWSAIDHGHMDMGWVARLGEDCGHIAMAMKLGQKTAGPGGFVRQNCEVFTYKAFTGEEYPLSFDVLYTIPVDINGDGYHELVRSRPDNDCRGEILYRRGNTVEVIGGGVIMASKFLDLPGEQIMSYYPDGVIRIWADSNARDSKEAITRYKNPLYRLNQRLTASGYNMVALGGI